ncbi:MAG: hypothetical protein M3Q51_02320 [Pseudomonadota bacterium]|nr:hypothetical protein [Pseudomonadota bacterium]
MRENDEEQRAMEARFRGLIVRWRLSPSETAALLDVDRDLLGLDLVPRAVDGNTEYRMRLLLEIGSFITTVCVVEESWSWLRSNELSLEHARSSPLQFLTGSISNLRAFRSMLIHA